MAPAGDAFHDPETGARTIVRKSGRDTEGAADVLETILPPGAVVAGHAGPLQVQRLQVVHGRLAVELAGETLLVAAGDRLAIPAGMPHRFRNVGEDDAQFVCEARPALDPPLTNTTEKGRR